MKINLATNLGKIKLKNPILVASGTFGYAKEFEKLIDLKKLGGIVTKTITLKPRLGNPPPRIVETPSGMLNAIGLQNPGADVFVRERMPFLRTLKIPIIVSVMGHSVEEFVEVVKFLEPVAGVDGFEMNLSCPNVSYQNSASTPKASAPACPAGRDSSLTSSARMFAHDAGMIEEVVSAVRKETKKTLIAKLSPDVSDIAQMALSSERGGADAVSLINTFMAMVIDIKTRRPVLGNKTGGLSGPCVRPIAVRMVWAVRKKVSIPIMGIGGIMGAKDALEFLIAGASAIQVGTANFINPQTSLDIVYGLRNFMQQERISDIKEIVGSVKE
ncbi:MAG: dihydroorotate dehydrogenase [Candidatus Omnitrophica bacterium CG07_land_8_20_14_0_80_50_8]|nr:MAG: dihydroorotate dehydrogenase [Candidatus Omnitrophica bacterium CG1_02_49_16]PIU40129.1 MAG: dihydroorotate dehydrogenase [Candidatus Omnitrophica bacterium CG07_land_8_20_14_0_80_50_8]